MQHIKFVKLEPDEFLERGDMQFHGLGPHGFDLGQPKTFAEYLEFHITHAALYEDFTMPTIMQLWEDVSRMYDHGMIDMVVENDMEDGARLRAFLEGLEMQQIDRIMTEGEIDDLRNLGRRMAQRIKEANSYPAQLNRILAQRLLEDVRKEE